MATKTIKSRRSSSKLGTPMKTRSSTKRLSLPTKKSISPKPETIRKSHTLPNTPKNAKKEKASSISPTPSRTRSRTCKSKGVFEGRTLASQVDENNIRVIRYRSLSPDIGDKKKGSSEGKVLGKKAADAENYQEDEEEQFVDALSDLGETSKSPREKGRELIEKDLKKKTKQEREERERRAIKEKEEKERREQERIEKESIENERLERERMEKEIADKERVKKERSEKERMEKERMEKERMEKEKSEQEILEKERIESEGFEIEAKEQERKHEEKKGQELIATKRQLQLSPQKKVVFSKDIESPQKSPQRSPGSPLKSILKPTLIPPNSPTIFELGRNSFHDLSKWQQGSIMQVQAGTGEVLEFLEVCMNHLNDPSCERKFEIYASLNLALSQNSLDFVLRKLCEISPKLMKIIYRDLSGHLLGPVQDRDQEAQREAERLAKISDPFENRIITQASKLLSYFVSKPTLIAVQETKTVSKIIDMICDKIYNHRSSIPKSVGCAYMSLFKDQKLSLFQNMSLNGQRKCYEASMGPKNSLLEKKYFLTLEASERMLDAVLKIPHYNSASVIVERSLVIKNFITEYPTMMEKHLEHWISFILSNIIKEPYHRGPAKKATTVSVAIFLEMAKLFMDCNSFKVKFRKYLESMAVDPNNMILIPVQEASELTLTNNGVTQKPLVSVFALSITTMIIDGNSKFAYDILTCATLLMANKKSPGIQEFCFDKWQYLPEWMGCFRAGFEISGAAELSLKASRALILIVGSRVRSLIESKADISELESVVKPLTKIVCYATASEIITSTESLINDFCLKTVYALFNGLDLENEYHCKAARALWDSTVAVFWDNYHFRMLKDGNCDGVSAFYQGMLRPKAGNCDCDLDNVIVIEPLSVQQVQAVGGHWICENFDALSPILKSLYSVRDNKHAQAVQLNIMTWILSALKSQKTPLEVLRQLASHLQQYINVMGPMTHDSDKHIVLIVMQYLDMVEAQEISNLTFLSQLVSKLADSYFLAVNFRLKKIHNALPVMKQLYFLKRIAGCGQIVIRNFVLATLDRRSLSDFTIQDCLITSQVIGILNEHSSPTLNISRKVLDKLATLKGDEIKALEFMCIDLLQLEMFFELLADVKDGNEKYWISRVCQYLKQQDVNCKAKGLAVVLEREKDVNEVFEEVIEGLNDEVWQKVELLLKEEKKEKLYELKGLWNPIVEVAESIEEPEKEEEKEEEIEEIEEGEEVAEEETEEERTVKRKHLEEEYPFPSKKQRRLSWDAPRASACDSLKQALTKFGDEEVKAMSATEKYEMESSLLKFMLKLRSS